MNDAGAIDMTPDQHAIVVAILVRYLPVGSQVSVFGSRALGRARAYSDLDLVIDAGRALTLAETGAVREAFSESDLPWKVDVVDRWQIGDRFEAVISASLVPLLVVEDVERG